MVGTLARNLALAFFLAGCEHPPSRPPECDSEYADTLMHCAPKRREATPEECSRAGGIQVWETWGTTKVYKGCTRKWPP
jgi:hypothetical protein